MNNPDHQPVQTQTLNPDPNRLEGRVIGKYRLEKKLGEGGMGVVYKAFDTALERPVALKMMHPMFSRDEKFLKRFKAEARALAKLDDSHIVSVHDLLETAEGLFIVMQFVESSSLHEVIKQTGPLRHEEACRMIKQVLAAIGHAHREGVLHRDIKPKNILLTSQGIIKVVDFGLAKIQQGPDITMSLETGGTLHYMSPEQVLGLVNVDRRSDIYSLGMTFYEMLTGRTPFPRADSDFAIRKAIVEEKFPPPNHYNPEVPAALAGIVARAIEKDPAKRFQEAGEMLAALERFEQQTPPPVKSKEKRRRDNRRLWRFVPPLTIGLAVTVLAFVLFPRFRSEKKNAPSPVPEKKLLIPAPAMVSIQVNPDEAQIILDDEPLSLANLANLELPPGQHHIRITAAGYAPKEVRFNLTSGNNPALRYDLDKIPPTPAPQPVLGGIKITSAPVRAFITLNGAFVGRTPYENDQIEPGSYRLQISLNGYEDHWETVVVRAGEMKRVAARLSAVAAVAVVATTLTIQSEPAGASVWVDGEEFADETTPCTISELASGIHQIVLRKPGYREHSESVMLKPGQKSFMETKLIAAAGKLKILVNPYGAISIDGKLHMREADRQYTTELSAGRHRLMVEHPQLGVWEKNIDVKPGQVNEVFVDFYKKVTLTIASNPVWGEIYVDGKSAGQQTPWKLALPIGGHTIEVRREGYVTEGGAKIIHLENDLKEALIFKLRKM